MAYKRNYRKKVYKKKPRVNKQKQLVTGRGPTMIEQIASGASSVAKVAQAVLPAIMAINTEHKYYDRSGVVTSYSPGANDSIVNLTGGIAQNVTDSGRIGNSILAKDIQVRLALSFQTTIGTPSIVGIHCRMMLICWKDNESQNTITAVKLFEDVSNLYSPVNKDYSDQFVVLKDKFFCLNANTEVTASQAFTSMKIFKPLGWHMRWDNTVSTQGHVFLVLRSSSSGSTNALSTTYVSRLNYTDN